jgi:hypothetical protein
MRNAFLLVFFVACGGTGDALLVDAGDEHELDASADAGDELAKVDASDAGELDASTCTATIAASSLAACATSATCFPSSGAPTCDPTLQPCADAKDFFYFCGANAACFGGGLRCCVSTNAAITSGACGTISAPDGAAAECEPQCKSGAWGAQLCTSNGQCEGGAGICQPKYVQGFAALDASVLGICE